MKFRRLPVVVEAVQFHMPAERPTMTGPDSTVEGLFWRDFGANKQHPCCHTLNGWVEVHDTDWIIKGVQGEFYPCDSEIFAATYEPAE